MVKIMPDIHCSFPNELHIAYMHIRMTNIVSVLPDPFINKLFIYQPFYRYLRAPVAYEHFQLPGYPALHYPSRPVLYF